jgi:hypothetical protein
MKNIVGTEVHVSLEPYYFGKARIVSVKPSHEYGKPEKLIDGFVTIRVAAVDMTCTSRLMGATSTKPVEQGCEFDLSVYEASLPHMIERGHLRYAYGV